MVSFISIGKGHLRPSAASRDRMVLVCFLLWTRQHSRIYVSTRSYTGSCRPKASMTILITSSHLACSTKSACLSLHVFCRFTIASLPPASYHQTCSTNRGQSVVVNIINQIHESGLYQDSFKTLISKGCRRLWFMFSWCLLQPMQTA